MKFPLSGRAGNLKFHNFFRNIYGRVEYEQSESRARWLPDRTAAGGPRDFGPGWNECAGTTAEAPSTRAGAGRWATVLRLVAGYILGHSRV